MDLHKKARSRQYLAETITDANTHTQAEFLRHYPEKSVGGIGFHVNANKTEFICFKPTGDKSTLNGDSLKLVDKFLYIRSRFLSIKSDINMRLVKAAIDRLSIMWKSNQSDDIKHSFFQTVLVSILLYEYITWTLTKYMERMLDRNDTRMLRAILNKFWKQHRTKQQLHGHESPIFKNIQIIQTSVTRKYDTLIYSPGYGEMRCNLQAVSQL